MASEGHHAQHLDATDREVVYCHACYYEWYRDEYGLECPSCESDITELVTLENDPRPAHENDSDSDSDDESDHIRETHGNVHNDEDDSDPEMADIDEHVDEHGFGYSHSTQVGEDADHHNAQPGQSVERFVDILTTIGMPFRQADGNGELMDRLREASRNGGGRVEWANETSQGSVTFYSSNGPFVAGENAPLGFEPFSALFSTAFRDFGVQLTGEAAQAAFQQGGGGPESFNLAGSLGEILGLLNNGVHGDAVYSQEAMDRIISSLMEANTQSGAAPPASEQGLANLPRRTIDEDLKSEDGNTECPICIEGIKVGEVEVSLPCKHSFHDECAVAWLKEHNTCPVCRAPIEEGTRTGNSTAAPQQQSQNESQSQHRRGQRHTPTPTDAPANNNRGMHPGVTGSAPSSTRPPLNFVAATTSGSSRPPNQSQTPLNEAIRLLSSQRGGREESRGATRAFSYDTSRLQRRSSMSPTSPRVALSEGPRTMRERSPSQSGRRTGASEDDQANAGGNAAMGWLRGRFVGGNNRRQG